MKKNMITDNIIYSSDIGVRINGKDSSIYYGSINRDQYGITAFIRYNRSNFKYFNNSYFKCVSIKTNYDTRQSLILYCLIMKLNELSIQRNEYDNIKIFPEEVFIINFTDKKINRENIKETIYGYDILKEKLFFNKENQKISEIKLDNFKNKINDKIKSYNSDLTFDISLNRTGTSLNFNISGSNDIKLDGSESILTNNKSKHEKELDNITLRDYFNNKFNNILKTSARFSRFDLSKFEDFINYILPYHKNDIVLKYNELDRAIGIVSNFDSEILEEVQNSEIFKERLQDFKLLVSALIKKEKPVKISVNNIIFSISINNFSYNIEFKIFSYYSFGTATKAKRSEYTLTEPTIKILAHLYNNKKLDHLIDKLELKTLQ